MLIVDFRSGASSGRARLLAMGIFAAGVLLAIFAFSPDKRLGILADLVVAIAAIIAGFLIASATSGSQAVPTCPQLSQVPLASAVVATSSTKGAEFSFSEATYSLAVRPPKQFYLTAAGAVDGPLPSSRRLYLLGTTLKNSRDSFGNTGTGTFLPQQALSLGCWKLETRRIGYSGACGLHFRYYFMSVPTAVARQFDANRAYHDLHPSDPNYGYSPEDMERLDAQPLAFFDMDTKGRC
jgi:hypothetical protein